MTLDEVRECFISALRDEKKGKKHKGLLLVKSDNQIAKEYIQKAKKNLEACDLFKTKGLEYKLPEEWFYTLYYCALAILAKFGVETRSQRCTASFLKYIKEKKLIDYDDDFINRIIVYKEKEAKSDVDEREESRYSSKVKIEEVAEQYDTMMGICRKAISQAEEIVFSDKTLKVPEEAHE